MFPKGRKKQRARALVYAESGWPVSWWGIAFHENRPKVVSSGLKHFVLVHE